MANVSKAIDKAGGYMYGCGEGSSISEMMSSTFGADYDYFKTASVKEKYFSMDTT